MAAQDDIQGGYYGRQIENPNMLMLFVDWTCYEAHMKFVNSPEYGAFGQKVLSITDSPYFHHLQSNPHPPSILGTAPITEFTTFYDVQPSYFDNLKEFVKRLGREKVDGYLGCAFGEVKEKIVRHEDVGNEGVEKGNAVVLLTGWESLEMHTRFEETGWFKENIGLLREGRGGVESSHVSFEAL
ncbi:hypothetical protein V8E51_018093 [Hyaloscypha variabilis]